MKIVKNQLKIVIFTAVKNRCILHGRVFVMKKVIHAAVHNPIPIDTGGGGGVVI